MIINGVELLYRKAGTNDPFVPTPSGLIHNTLAENAGWVDTYTRNPARIYDLRWECPLCTIAREEESDEQAG